MESLPSLKVLLIEDNPSDVLFLQTALEVDPINRFELTYVERLADGLKQLGEAKFDIVLADLGLPDSSGLETFKRLHEQSPDLPFVVFSGNDDETQAVEAVRAGAQDYLVKSLNGFDMAARTIRYAIERNKMQFTLRESERRFNILFRLNPVPVGITRASDYAIVDVNDAWSGLSGYTREEAIGRTSTELRLVKPETLQQVRDKLGSQGKIGQIEISLYTRSGEERNILISSEPIELDGEVYFFNNLLDITERKQAERKLHESEERHRLISELISDFVYKGRVFAHGESETNWVSGAFERITGYRLDEVNQFPNGFFDLVQPTDLEALMRGQAQFFQDRSRTAEYRIRKKNGDICWLRDYMQITEIDPQTSTLQIMGAVQDITGRKRAEEKLLRNEEVLRLFVEYSPAAIAMFDRDMRFIIASQRYSIDYRLGDQNLIGRSQYDIFPEMTERQKAIHQRCLAGAVEKNDGYPFQRMNGTVDWVRWEIHPWYETNGEVGGIIFFSEVITERKQAEEKLRASEERYRNLIENMNELVMEVDERGSFCYISPNYTKLAGYSSELELNTSALAHVHPDDIPMVLQTLENESFNTGQSIVYRLQIQDGSWHWIETSGHSYQTETGEKHIISVARDVTERKQAEEALKESEERFSKAFFTSPVSQSIITRGTNEIVEVNDAACRLFGYSREDLIGASTAKLNLWQNPADRLAAVEELQKTGRILPREATIQTKSGETRTTLAAIEPITWKGSPCLISFVVDITERKKAEDALRNSEERLRKILQTTSDGFWIVDSSRRFVDVNEAYCSMSGYSREELLQKSISDVEVLQAVQDIETHIKVILRDGSDRFESRHRRKDGSAFDVEISINVLNQENGFMVCFIRDITERKKAEQEAIYRQDLLEKVIQLGKKIAAITDLNQCLREIHQSVVHGLGFDRVGVFLYDADANTIRGTYGTSRAGEMVNNSWYVRPVEEWIDWQVALHNPKGMVVIEDYQASRCPAPDNEMYGVKQHITMAAWVGKKPVGLITVDNLFTGRDIKPTEMEALQLFAGYAGLAIENATLHTDLEKKVEERTKEVQDLYDNAPTGYHSLDAEGRFTQVNQTELNWLGYTREELMGRSVQEILTPDSIETFRRSYPRFKQAGVLHDLEMNFIRKDQTILPALVNASAMYDSRGNYTMSRSTIFDNTLRRQAEESLQHANIELERALRMKDEFLASMSHELRTPLTGILGLSEALQYNTYGEVNQKQKSILANIESNGRHLLDLINDILDISKMEAGKFELEMLSCQLSEICQSSLQLVKGMAQKKGQQVAFSMKPTDIMIKGDARRIKQILVNLLSNAIKYSPENSPIGLDVYADPSTKTVTIDVWDKGMGISPEDMKRLFKPFVQLDSSLSRQQTGTGLGLALVQRLVDMHGGSIQVESVLGQGSRFLVVLPYQHGEIAPQDETTAIPTQIQQSLIVEDSGLDADRLSRFLKLLGIHSTIKNTGVGVVEKAATLKPDVILLDINLPDVTGWDVLKKLKQNAVTSDIPVVITSVLENYELANQLGAAGYLVKLFTLDDLQRTLARLPSPKGKNQDTALVVSPEVHYGTIMVVDDNETNVVMIEDYLRAKKYNVFSASSGIQFLNQVSEICPDLVLMDIQMPDMDGLETIRRLRLLPDPELDSIPVIAITALAMPGDRESCLEAGANEYLSKPIRLRELVSVIQNMLSDMDDAHE